MAQSAIAVANYFVRKGNEEGIPITPMKVQKLVYIAHGWHLALTDDKLIDDKIGAWPFGPVIGSIYKKFADYSRKPIDALAINPNTNTPCELNNPSEQTLEILNAVWQKYKNATASALSNMTHDKGSPWEKSYQEGKSEIIDDGLIKQYYKGRLN